MCEDPTDAGTYWLVGDEFTGVAYQLVVYRSTDAGNTWPHRYQLTDTSQYAYGYSIHCAAKNPDVVYAGGYLDNSPVLYRTLDGGATWDDITGDMSSGAYNYVFEIWSDPDDIDTIVAGTNSGAYRTADGGATWSNTNVTDRVRDIVYFPAADTLYMGTLNDGVYTSTDKGATWSEENGGLKASDIPALSADHKNGWIFAATFGNGACRLDVAESLFLALSPDPLQAGWTLDIAICNGIPNEPAWLAYCTAGWGSVPVPPLGIVLDIASPQLGAGPSATNSSGEYTWTVTIPPSAAGLTLWFQAAQNGLVSNAMATWCE
jgi:hypothetical protein